MAMFNSYVTLPEGTWKILWKIYGHLRKIFGKMVIGAFLDGENWKLGTMEDLLCPLLRAAHLPGSWS